MQHRIATSTSSVRSGFAITPDDDNDLPQPARGLNCSDAGSVSVIYVDDTDPVTITVAPGWNPDHVKRVRATGTDAMTIVGAKQ